MTTVDLSKPQRTQWWTGKEGKAPALLETLAERLVEHKRLSWENFYLTESHRGVPMLIIKGSKRWCSVSFMRRRGRFFRLFTNYTPGARALIKADFQEKLWLGRQQRHDFVEEELIIKFIENEGWERYLSDFSAKKEPPRLVKHY